MPEQKMIFQNIKYKDTESIAIIEIDRPKYLNALCDDLMLEISTVLNDIESNRNIKVVILKGSNRAFAAGADITEMAEKEYADHINKDFIKNWEKISEFKKPIIASVAGYALGGGCEIAMMCDIIVAAKNAQFGQPEINLGTIPASGGTQRLIRSVGKSKAMEMILTGNMINAEDAFRLGLVSLICSEEELDEKTFNLAKKISQKSLPVLMLAKEAVNRANESNLREGNLFERRLFQSTFALNDRKEGMKAFLEKRRPIFKDK